ncbi:MAG: response regulator [Candidatus Aureabacteria bacterium]|nr:response regulator [Candidatus Auribacterota bacterium]
MKRVLIVDDEPIVRRFISLCLQGRYITEEAEDGEKALSKAVRRQYDCVITDVQMPRMDGLSLLEEIKKRAPRTAVIVMSGAGEEHSSAALQNGASSFLSKPFLVDTLHSALQCV